MSSISGSESDSSDSDSDDDDDAEGGQLAVRKGATAQATIQGAQAVFRTAGAADLTPSAVYVWVCNHSC